MFERRLPKHLRERDSSLGPWQEFESSAVAKVLRILASAFRWTQEDAQRLRPDDSLWAIYYSYYPQDRWWQKFTPDELEMESAYRYLDKEAPGCGAELHRPDVTVGDLVRRLAS